jgi:phosphohistidine phosphatase SixA
MTKWVELRRHTACDGDVLTPDGIRAAVDIGRRLHDRYDILVSSGAQRATQTIACMLAGMTHPVERGVTVDGGFRSAVEQRWFAAASSAKGGDLESFRKVDPDLVEKESALFAAAIRRIFAQLPEGGRAMIVGHSPMHEAAVYGLCGEVTPPISKGGAVVVAADGKSYRLEAVTT